MKLTLSQRVWDFLCVHFFSNLCDRKLLVQNRIFAGLMEKAVGELLGQVNLLNYLLGKTS